VFGLVRAVRVLGRGRDRGKKPERLPGTWARERAQASRCRSSSHTSPPFSEFGVDLYDEVKSCRPVNFTDCETHPFHEGSSSP
jgi:hypothetical protein